MSPASSGGTLEVEKYIGACLITQQRPKAGGFYSRVPEAYPGSYYRIQRCNSADRWAGGMPLISFANHQKKEEHTPLARLAVHTQGAPLILTKSFNRRNKNQKKAFDGKKAAKSVDTVSVTSDESSGSANSDNCLPRIIKPRKRRKKDRKPSIHGNQDGFSTDSASPDIDAPVLQPYTPFIFDPHVYGLVPGPSTKVDDKEETPQLHHSFEDVEELEDVVDINGNQTVCQCRYCDPSGQIWDVDRSCYSPFLTTPRKPFSFDSFLSKYTSAEQCVVHGMASMSLDDKSKDPKHVPSGDLEVSTEIVTSLNGHRDIEIKFFSSSSVDSVRASPKAPGRILNDTLSCESVNNECKFDEISTR